MQWPPLCSLEILSLASIVIGVIRRRVLTTPAPNHWLLFTLFKKQTSLCTLKVCSITLWGTYRQDLTYYSQAEPPIHTYSYTHIDFFVSMATEENLSFHRSHTSCNFITCINPRAMHQSYALSMLGIRTLDLLILPICYLANLCLFVFLLSDKDWTQGLVRVS